MYVQEISSNVVLGVSECTTRPTQLPMNGKQPNFFLPNIREGRSRPNLYYQCLMRNRTVRASPYTFHTRALPDIPESMWTRSYIPTYVE